MEFYSRQPSDPEWLVRAGDFHGHLGPWLVIGAMIGHDAVKRLHTPGHWELEVICWMPPEKQRPPSSCILDGLQVSTGATMGKRNIRVDFSPEVVRTEQPVVYIMSKATSGHAARGFAYQLSDKLVSMLSKSSPEQIEQLSREMAATDPGELFQVRPMPENELAPIGPGSRSSDGRAQVR